VKERRGADFDAAFERSSTSGIATDATAPLFEFEYFLPVGERV
jgi:hypothetical protein